MLVERGRHDGVGDVIADIAAHPDGISRRLHGTPGLAALDLDEHVARQKLGMGEKLVDGVDGRTGHARLVELVDPMLDILGLGHRLDGGDQLRPVPAPEIVGGEQGMKRHFRRAQRIRHQDEQRVVARRDHDAPVLGGKAFERRQGRMAVAGAVGTLPSAS